MGVFKKVLKIVHNEEERLSRLFLLPINHELYIFMIVMTTQDENKKSNIGCNSMVYNNKTLPRSQFPLLFLQVRVSYRAKTCELLDEDCCI